MCACIVDRLGDCVGPYQHALETEAGKRQVPLYLEGLLSRLDRKNAERLAVLGDGERLGLQEFIGTAPGEHRPLIRVLVGQGIDQSGEPAGVRAFDPRSFPKRGRQAVGVKRQGGSHRGKVANCQVGVCMGSGSRPAHAWLDCRLSGPEAGARDEPRRHAGHGPEAGSYRPRHEPGRARLALWGAPVPPGGGTGDAELGRPPQCRQALRERGAR